MAESWGPAYSGRQVYFTYAVTNLSNTQTRVDVTAYLYIASGWSTYGTWYQSWAGYWGDNGQNQTINSGGNTIHQIVSGSYTVARGSSDFNIVFGCTAQTSTGQVYHGITLTIPKIPATVPPAPSPIGIDQITNSSMRYRFSSNGNGGSAITKYEVQYSRNSNFSSATTITSTGTSTVTGLLAKTTYYFRSRAVNAVGNGSWSASRSDATLDVPGTPTVTIAGRTPAVISLDVVNPSYTGGGITARQTQLARTTSFATVSSTSTAAQPSFTGLTRGTQYYVRSRVQNGIGWSAWTSAVGAKTLVEIPSAPTGYSMSDIASTTAYVGLPLVVDNGGTALVNVRVQRNTSTTETGATLVTEGAFRAVFLSGLSAGVQYYVRMSVQNSGEGSGWSAYGPWVAFTTRDDVPTPPLSLAISAIGNNVATLTWAAPSSLMGSELLNYAVRLSTSGGFGQGLQETLVEPDTLSESLTGLQPGTRYYVQVRGLSSNGPGSFSTVATFLTTGTAPIPQSMWLRIAGAWKPGKLWIRVSGAWKQGVLWQNIEDEWKRGA